MLLIPCPHCGPREESGFSFGGAAIRLPAMDGTTGKAEWHKAIHLREIRSEPTEELWFHHGGCETWITLIRDTKTHAFIDETGP